MSGDVRSVLYMDPRITGKRRVRWWVVHGRSLFGHLGKGRIKFGDGPECEQNSLDHPWWDLRPSDLAAEMQAYLRRESAAKLPSVACVAYDVGRDQLWVLVTSPDFDRVMVGFEPPLWGCLCGSD